MASSSDKLWLEMGIKENIVSEIKKIEAEIRNADSAVKQTDADTERLEKTLKLLSAGLRDVDRARPLKDFGLDKSSLSTIEKQVNDLTNRLSQLGKAINETMAIQSKHPTNATQTAITNMAEEYSRLEKHLNALYITYEKLSSVNVPMINKGVGFGDAGMKAQEHARRQKELNEAFGKYFRLQEQEAAASARSEAALRRQNAARQESTKTLREQSEALVRSRRAMLEAQQTALFSSLKSNKGILNPQEAREIRSAILAVTKEIKTLDMVMSRLSSYNTGVLRAFGSGAGMSGTAGSDAIARVRDMQIAHEQAANAVMKHTQAQRGLRSSTEEANQGLKTQSQVLGELRTMATQYLGVWGGQQFLRKIIETGGQLEMQRLSIAAILQDSAAADKLFGQIKNLAVKSPFGVVELDQMSKQLSAYGFQAHELFEWTKRLADISAATGTDVGRLALALGHVRSEAALSGYTLRQFSMANVPMAKKLSEYLSKIEGHAVSIAEVRKRVRGKEIGYEDVVAVLKELTDKGGMFYNTQEVMSESLKAKFKNLRDSMDIMYGEMAESGIGGGLKVIAETLTNLTRHWEELVAVLGSVGAIWVAQKAILLMRSRSLSAMNNTLTTYQLNLRRMTAAELDALVTSGQITKQSLLQSVALGRVSVAEAELAAATYGVSRAQLEQIATSGKVSTAMMRTELWASKYSVAQLRTVAAIRASTGVSKGFAVALSSLIVSFRSVGAAIRSMMSAFLPMLVIGGLVEMFMRVRNQAEDAAKATNDAFARVEEGVSHVKQAIENMPNPAEKLNGADLKAGIEKAEQVLRNYSPVDANSIIKHANAMKSLSDQYRYLYEQVALTNQALDEYKRTADAIEFGIKETGGSLGLDDNLYGDLKDYQNTLKTFSYEVGKFYAEDRKRATDAIDAAAAEDESFKKRIESMDNYSEKLQFLIENQQEFSDAWSEFRSKYTEGMMFTPEQLNEFEFAPAKIKADLEEATGEMDKFIEGYKARLAGYGYDFDNLDPLQVKNLRMQIHDFLNSEEWGAISDEMKDFWRNYLSQKMNITFTAEQEEALVAVDELKDRLENLVNPDGKGQGWIIDIKGATNIEDVIDKIKKGYKEAKEFIETSKPILIKLGITSTDGASLWSDDYIDKMSNGDAFVKQVLERVKQQSAVVSQALQVHNQFGLPLEDPKKKKTKKSSSGSKTDKVAKAMSERVSVLKDAYSEYKKWVELSGKEAALLKVKNSGIFSSLFSDKEFLGLDDYRGELKRIRGSLNPAKAEQRKVIENIDKILLGMDYDDAKEKAEKDIALLQSAMDKLGKAWDNYKSLYEKTGNKSFAELAFSNGTLWDEKTKAMADELGKRANLGTIDFTMSEESAKEFFNYNTTKGKALYDLWKQIVDLIRENYDSGLNDTAAAMAELMDEEDKILKIEQEIADLRAKPNDPRVIKKQREIEELQQKAFEKSGGYLKFYNAILSMTIPEAEKIGQEIREKLDKSLQRGTISAKEYVRQIKLIGEQMKKLRDKQSNFSSLINGGLQGLFQNKYDNAESDFNKYATDVEKAASKYEKAFAAGDEAGMKSAESAQASAESMKAGAAAAMQGAQGAMSTVAMIDKIVHGINDVVQGIKGTFDEIREMYDALGSDTESDNWEGWNTFFSGFSKASQNATNAWDSLKNGNVGGVIQGVVGSFTSWVTEFSRGHDRKLDHQIKLAQEQINAIDRLTKITEMELNRTLGALYNYRPSESTNNQIKEWYDEVSVTRKTDEKLRKVFGPRMDLFGEDTEKALLKAVNSGEYYDEQLALLLKKRDEIKEQLSAEEDKKDNDSEKIADYKQSIAEIGDQIKNFAEDMAKALYDIDIKSWASQLTDAVVDAWVAGKDAAQAWHDKVKDLVKDITKNILAQKVVEVALQPVLDYITEEMTAKSGKLDESSIMQLSKLLNDAGDTAITGITSILDAMKEAGYDLSDTKSGTSSVSQVLSGLSENDQSLLMSYINAIRGDVSIQRGLMEQLVGMMNGTFPNMNATVQLQLRELETISVNTRRNADSAEFIETFCRGLRDGEYTIKVK